MCVKYDSCQLAVISVWNGKKRLSYLIHQLTKHFRFYLIFLKTEDVARSLRGMAWQHTLSQHSENGTTVLRQDEAGLGCFYVPFFTAWWPSAASDHLNELSPRFSYIIPVSLQCHREDFLCQFIVTCYRYRLQLAQCTIIQQNNMYRQTLFSASFTTLRKPGSLQNNTKRGLTSFFSHLH